MPGSFRRQRNSNFTACTGLNSDINRIPAVSIVSTSKPSCTHTSVGPKALLTGIQVTGRQAGKEEDPPDAGSFGSASEALEVWVLSQQKPQGSWMFAGPTVLLRSEHPHTTNGRGGRTHSPLTNKSPL